MKNILVVGMALTGLALVGCSSAPNVDANGKTLAGKIDVESKKTISWDESKSYALNISRMGHPAGLGIGLRDSEKPNEAKIDKDNNSLFNFYAGYVAGGVLGGFGSLAMDSLSEDARNWAPYFVQTISKSEIGDVDKSDAGAFMLPLIEKINKVAKEKFNNSYVIGVYYNNTYNNNFNNIIALSGDFCTLAAKYNTEEGSVINPLRELQYRVANADFKEISAISNACYVSLDSNLVGEYNGEYVFTHKISTSNIGVFFGLSLAGDASFPTVFPNTFAGLNANNGKSLLNTFEASFVTNEGKNYFFDKNEISNSPL